MKLEEQYVLSKTKAASLADVRNLNLWGNGITDVSVVTRMPNVEVLSLSVNRIASLKDFAQCPNLQELYLRKNEVADLDEVRHLSGLKNLRVLWLCDNPCASRDDYRACVIRALPSITKLDNTEITPLERASAETAGAEPGARGRGQAPSAPQRAGDAAGARGGSSENILYAVLALLRELDEARGGALFFAALSLS